MLQTRVGNEDWKDLKQWTISRHDLRRPQLSARLVPAELKLKAGDVLLYRAVASDFREPEANMGVGRTWSLTVAAPAKGENPFLAQAKRLYESLEQILALQRQNRNEFDLDAALLSVRQRQEEIRDLTLKLVDQQRNTPGGINAVIAPPDGACQWACWQATQLLEKQDAAVLDHVVRKQAILAVMDKIIARLEEIIGNVKKSVAAAEKAYAVLQKLSPEDRERALQRIRDLVQNSATSSPNRTKCSTTRKSWFARPMTSPTRICENWSRPRARRTSGTRSSRGRSRTFSKLTEQNLADRTIANDYKEMVEQIDGAGKKLQHPKGGKWPCLWSRWAASWRRRSKTTWRCGCLRGPTPRCGSWKNLWIIPRSLWPSFPISFPT